MAKMMPGKALSLFCIPGWLDNDTINKYVKFDSNIPWFKSYEDFY